jgi:glyoxylase-like metal-dependent hydrolase (beta-lactamase superfamily II)/rhodanese-related sulfurtransferase
MKIEQIYTGCLAQGAYYIESNGEAVIIDPLRDTKAYTDRANASGAKIKYILETHFHADFVSGHLDLQVYTGATIVFGPNAKTEFISHIATDGEILQVGSCTIEVLHTPGHTMESTCYLLRDENGKQVAVFTGDTLFIGDVGRPDLAQKAGELTKEDLAGYLYDSLRNKLMPLENDITVYPAHGAGSACGKNMSKETFDTLGHQKEVNYALQDMTKEAFIQEVTAGLLPPPFYFPENVAMNKKGVSSLEGVVQHSLKPLSVEAFTVLMEDESVLLLDVRGPQVFCKGFVPGSVNIGLKGDFAPWVGTLITDMKQRIALVTEPGQEEEAITRLARVGYDGVVGYLEGGFEAWDKSGNEIDQIESISAEVFAELASDKKVNTIDVRKPTEFQAEHLEIGISAPLHELNSHMSAFKTGENNYIHCAGGYRSMIAASILKSRGIHNVIDIAGGYNAISKTALPKTNFVCPSTL